MKKIFIAILLLAAVTSCNTSTLILENGKKAYQSKIKKLITDTLNKEYPKRFGVSKWRICSVKVFGNTIKLNTRQRKNDFGGLGITLDSGFTLIEILETYTYR